MQLSAKTNRQLRQRIMQFICFAFFMRFSASKKAKYLPRYFAFFDARFDFLLK